MLTLRRSGERQHVQRCKHNVWQTFFPREDPGATCDFGLLATFNEVRLSPGAAFTPHPHVDAEVITYVCRGALAQKSSTGATSVVRVGEFQQMTISRGSRPKETNASKTGWAHVFRIGLRSLEAGLDCAQEQKRFATAKRHNVKCVIASPDGQQESLRINQDAFVFSSVLDPGHHLIHELLPGRSAWLHIIYGEATLHDVLLVQGDGIGVTSEPSVSITAQENTEVLLVDLGSTPSDVAP